MITLLSKFEARHAQAASDLMALLLELRSSVGNEEGHLSYQILSTADDSLTLWVLESWESHADADRHGQLVVSNGAVGRATPLLVAPIVTARVTADQ
jgi:quinol monooxygenase YgiN